MLRRQFIVIALLAAGVMTVACAICAPSATTRAQQQRPPVTVFDFRAGHNIWRLPWPTKPPTDILFIEQPTLIDLRLPDGVLAVITVDDGKVWRDGNNVRSIMLDLPPQTAEDALASAHALAAQLQVGSTKPLDDWYAAGEWRRVPIGHVSVPSIARADAHPGRSISLVDSGLRDRPFCVRIGFGFFAADK